MSLFELESGWTKQWFQNTELTVFCVLLRLFFKLRNRWRNKRTKNASKRHLNKSPENRKKNPFSTSSGKQPKEIALKFSPSVALFCKRAFNFQKICRIYMFCIVAFATRPNLWISRSAFAVGDKPAQKEFAASGCRQCAKQTKTRTELETRKTQLRSSKTFLLEKVAFST